MSDVTSLNAERAARAQDNRLLSPVECLRDAMRAIESGDRACDKVLVLTLDTSGDRFGVGYFASQLRGSEILALCEAMKARMLAEMGFVGGPD